MCSSDLFTKVAIHEVVKTLFEAVVLVFLIMRVGFAKQRSGSETVHNHGQGVDLFAYLA